ncbi:MAG: ribulokinase, partial [Clostridia bacterium]|nr:ribulokinase [Clostridia bacterium]
KERGGYDDIYEAVLKMGGVNSTVYRPDPENSRIYDELYKQYVILHDLFGRGANDVMKVLKGIKAR